MNKIPTKTDGGSKPKTSGEAESTPKTTIKSMDQIREESKKAANDHKKE